MIKSPCGSIISMDTGFRLKIFSHAAVNLVGLRRQGVFTLVGYYLEFPAKRANTEALA